jgi:hypothetical protein
MLRIVAAVVPLFETVQVTVTGAGVPATTVEGVSVMAAVIAMGAPFYGTLELLSVIWR